MVWRVVEYDDRRWNISIAAERRASSEQWNLVFSFRPADLGQRAFWATYPLSSMSRSALFAQAAQIPDAVIAAFIAEHLQ